jgi:hypothetical protein
MLNGCGTKPGIRGREFLEPDAYDISYGDGLLQESIILEDDVALLETYERSEQDFPKAHLHLSTPPDQENISYGSSHLTPSPGINVTLTQRTTQRAAKAAFDCEAIYKLGIVDWPAERFREMPEHSCRGVRFLKLKNCVVDHDALDRIGKLPNLEGLWFTLCKVSHVDLSLVTRPQRHRLKVLSLFHSGFGDDSVSAINDLRSIQVLEVSEPAMTNDFFKRLKAPMLRTLEVGRGGPPNVDLAPLLRRDRPALKIMYGE